MIEADGTVCRRTTSTSEIVISDAAMSTLTTASISATPNLATAVGSRIHMVRQSNQLYFTAVLDRFFMRAPFKMFGDRLVPNFTGTDPVIEMVWVPPEGCTLKMLIQPEVGLPRLYCSWFLAFDERGNAWRLPLPNVYDDCRVCTGQPATAYGTHLGMVADTLEKFRESRWNADLWSEPEKTQALFQWIPHNDGFEQVFPKSDDWTNYSYKISIPVLRFVL